MRALLVQPLTPTTYWGFQHSLRIVGKSAALPPLGLASLAALLPRSWELRIKDLNLAPLRDNDLRWADAVLLTGMLVHAPSMHEVLARARRLGRRTIVGGPAANTDPSAFPEADHVFRGEAEGRVELLVRALEGAGPAPRLLSPPDGARPDMSAVPAPRFDLLDRRRYASMSIQFSRGCPFHCEFCDIVEVFGHTPRVKCPTQMLAELDALSRTGYRGTLFVVDDNFIGNRRAVAALLPHVQAWQEERGFPFELYTEASVDLASQPQLLSAMVAAGFSTVFVGLESPSTESLRAVGKLQNLRMDPAEAVLRLTHAGLEVYAGFIVGFDTDGPDIFQAQRAFVSALPIPTAMVGLLQALPGTALWRRLEREGRLRPGCGGDQFDRPNFVPTLDEGALIEGYASLLASLYEPEAFYRRCERVVDEIGRGAPHHLRPGGISALLRAALAIGVLSPRRRLFWRLLWRALRCNPSAFARAVGQAVQGEHLIRYTREDVLPRLERTLVEIACGRASSVRAHG